MKNDILDKKEDQEFTFNYGAIDFFLKLFKVEYDNYKVNMSLIRRLISHLKELRNNNREGGK